jgi:hypothetical protein
MSDRSRRHSDELRLAINGSVGPITRNYIGSVSGSAVGPPLPPGPQDLPRDYGPDGAAGGRSRSTPRRADDTTTRLRERADASVRRPGLGARLLATLDEARAGYALQFGQRFFLSDSQRISFRLVQFKWTYASFLATA